MRADLAAPHWDITARGILIEDKDDIRKRLGRSPDKGDAIVMCWAEGQRAVKRGIVGALPWAQRERPKFAKVSERHAKVRRLCHRGRPQA